MILTENLLLGATIAQPGAPESAPSLQFSLAPALRVLQRSYVVGNSWNNGVTFGESSQGALISGSIISEFVRFDRQRFLAHEPIKEVASLDVSKENLTVKVLQRWTGRVKQVKQDRFVAVITDFTNRSNPDEEIEMDIQEVSSDDRPLVSPGATFYWSIAYRDSKAGQRIKIALIRFARQPKLSGEEIQDIFNEADELATALESA